MTIGSPDRLDDVVGEDLSIADAANCCPVQAISVTEVATGRLIAPEE